MASSDDKPFTVIAHRGHSAGAPENTAAAFDLALQQGFAHFECDVQLTSDGVCIVLHDEELGRTLAGHGRVIDTPWADLSQLDAGVWKGAQHAGVRVPTLPALLQRYLHQAHIHLELKSADAQLPPAVAQQLKLYACERPDVWSRVTLPAVATDGGRSHEHSGTRQSDAPTSSTVDRLPPDLTAPGLTVTSFHLHQLKALAALLPAVRHSWLVQELSPDVLAEAAAAGVHQLCPRANALTPAAVSAATAAGFFVRAWGVRSLDLLAHVAECGVLAATVNWPDEARTMLEGRGRRCRRHLSSGEEGAAAQGGTAAAAAAAADGDSGRPIAESMEEQCMPRPRPPLSPGAASRPSKSPRSDDHAASLFGSRKAKETACGATESVSVSDDDGSLRARLLEQGYLLLPRFFEPEDLALMEAECEEIYDRCCSGSSSSGGCGGGSSSDAGIWMATERGCIFQVSRSPSQQLVYGYGGGGCGASRAEPVAATAAAAAAMLPPSSSARGMMGDGTSAISFSGPGPLASPKLQRLLRELLLPPESSRHAAAPPAAQQRQAPLAPTADCRQDPHHAPRLPSPHTQQHTQLVQPRTTDSATAASSATGAAVRLLNEQYIIKPPRCAASAFAWHRDSDWIRADPDLAPRYRPYVSLWAAIDDVGDGNGSLVIAPNSHDSRFYNYQGHGGDGGTPLQLSLPPPPPAGQQPCRSFTVCEAAGCLVVMVDTLLHRSGPNLSRHTRRVWMPQFTAAAQS